MRTKRPCDARFIAATILAVFALAPSARAESLGDKAQAEIEKVRKARDLVGVSAAISIGDETVWSGAAGYADIENNVPATPTMVHRIASISKPMTATAVMRLSELKIIDLDRTLESYVPEL